MGDIACGPQIEGKALLALKKMKQWRNNGKWVAMS